MDLDKYYGIPWVQGACGFDAADCWGLVRLFLKNEFNIDIQKHISATHTGCMLTDVIDTERGGADWALQDGPHPHAGDVAVLFDRVTGRPTHVGVCVDSFNILHSIHAGHNGFSQINKIAVLQRVFNKIEFYKYAGYNATH